MAKDANKLPEVNLAEAFRLDRALPLAEAEDAFRSIFEKLLRPKTAFIISRLGNLGHVQFHSQPDGRVYGETASNEVLGVDCPLDAAQILELRLNGWRAPVLGRKSKQMNFWRWWDGPATPEDIAPVALHALRDVFGVKRLEHLWLTWIGEEHWGELDF